jgi:hypothetical protein
MTLRPSPFFGISLSPQFWPDPKFPQPAIPSPSGLLAGPNPFPLPRPLSLVTAPLSLIAVLSSRLSSLAHPASLPDPLHLLLARLPYRLLPVSTFGSAVLRLHPPRCKSSASPFAPPPAVPCPSLHPRWPSTSTPNPRSPKIPNDPKLPRRRRLMHCPQSPRVPGDPNSSHRALSWAGCPKSCPRRQIPSFLSPSLPSPSPSIASV